MSTIKSTSASKIPGDTLRAMSRPHRDAKGQIWPKGTTFRPLSAGNDGQTVSIQGQAVRFPPQC